MVTLCTGPWSPMPAFDPIMNSPAGTTTISGHSGQSLNHLVLPDPGLKHSSTTGSCGVPKCSTLIPSQSPTGADFSAGRTTPIVLSSNPGTNGSLVPGVGLAAGGVGGLETTATCCFFKSSMRA